MKEKKKKKISFGLPVRNEKLSSSALLSFSVWEMDVNGSTRDMAEA